MDLPDTIGETARLVSLPLIPLFLISDVWLTHVIRLKCPDIKSWYFEVQKKFGFNKAMVVKIVFSIFAYNYAESTVPSGWHPKSIGALLYFGLMFGYVLDYMKHITQKNEPSSDTLSKREDLKEE